MNDAYGNWRMWMPSSQMNASNSTRRPERKAQGTDKILMNIGGNAANIGKWAKYAVIAVLALYGLAILVAGVLSYDIIYLLHSPVSSVEKMHEFSLMLGTLSISAAILVAIPKTYRKKFTLAALLLAPAVIMSGEYAYRTQYRGAYAQFQDVGPHGHEQIAKFSLAGKQETKSSRNVNDAILEQYKYKMHGARELLYSLPFKQKFEEGMDAANKEREYFMKKQEEVNASQKLKPKKQENGQ